MTTTSTWGVLTGMMRWLTPTPACKKVWSGPKKWLSISLQKGYFEAHILYAKEGGKKPLLRFKLECINVLLAASATEPSAPTASDRFSGRHFPELITPTQSKQNPQKRCLVCTSNKKEKKANTNVEIVHTSFKTYHIEWDWTLIMNFFFHVP